MKKNIKKKICLLLALCVLAAVPGGCGQQDTNAEPGETGSRQETESLPADDTEQPSQESADSTEDMPAFANVNEYVFATMNANLHTGPSESSLVAAVVVKDTLLTRTGYTSDWSRVIYEQQEYYIQTRYLRSPNAGEALPTDAESEAAPTPTPLPEATPTPTPVPTGDILSREQMSLLDNTTIGWGYASADRDEYNRPNGCLYYQRLYGQYGAEFIKDNTNTIYLTFDEGYEAGYTPAILDTLKEKNVKAVFFVTLSYCKQNPELVQRMIDEGHVVGNHSASHPSGGLPQYGMDYTEEDMMSVHEYVKENFGYEMYLMRYPEGAFSEQSLALMQSLGYRCIFWSFAHQDWNTDNQPAVSDTYERVTSQLHNGAIYLLHAVSSSNTAVLGDFIDYAREQGYEFGYYE